MYTNIVYKECSYITLTFSSREQRFECLKCYEYIYYFTYYACISAFFAVYYNYTLCVVSTIYTTSTIDIVRKEYNG